MTNPQTTEREDAYGRVGIPDQCLTCDGSGRADDDTCGTCGGEGFVCWWGASRSQKKERETDLARLLAALVDRDVRYVNGSIMIDCGSQAEAMELVANARTVIAACLEKAEA